MEKTQVDQLQSAERRLRLRAPLQDLSLHEDGNAAGSITLGKRSAAVPFDRVAGGIHIKGCASFLPLRSRHGRNVDTLGSSCVGCLTVWAPALTSLGLERNVTGSHAWDWPLSRSEQERRAHLHQR